MVGFNFLKLKPGLRRERYAGLMATIDTDLILITTTLAGSQIANRRRNNLVKVMSGFKIPIVLNHGIVPGDGVTDRDAQFLIQKNGLEMFKNTRFNLIDH